MIEFTNLAKTKPELARFIKIYQKIFPKSFELSVVFADQKLMRTLNFKHKNKKKSADVLSFTIIPGKMGEMFLNAREKNAEYLFTHGCLHLKGYNHDTAKHAKIMRKLEEKFLKNE